MRRPTRALCAALALLAAPALADDLTVVSKVTRDGADVGTSTSYVSADHARISQPDGNDVIIDLKAGQMTVIDNRKKEYFVITRQDMEQMKARLQQMMNSPEMQRAQEQMKNLPPDVQKRMQGMMGGMASSFDVKKTGTTKKVAGYTCEEWAVTMGQFSKTLQCVSTEVPVPVQAWESYREWSDSMRGMMAAMGPMGKSLGDLQSKFAQMRGFPLSVSTSTNVMGHSSSSTSEVVEIKRGAIPASAWEVPAGLRKIDNPMAKELGRR